MPISARQLWLLGSVAIALSLLGFLTFNVLHMLIYTPHGASPMFTYAPLHIKMMTDNSVELLNGNPEGAEVAPIPPLIDFGVLDINPQKYGTDYGNWGNVVRGPDGKYY